MTSTLCERIDTAAELHACLDRVVARDLVEVPAAGLIELIAELRRAESRVAAARLRVIAEAERRQIARRAGAASTTHWVATLTHTDSQAAHQMVELAHDLQSLGATGAALDQGVISAEHARVIAHSQTQLPTHLSDQQRQHIECALVAKAQEVPPAQLRRLARRSLAVVGADQRAVDAHENDLVAERERHAQARTQMTLHDNGDGTVTGRFIVPVFHGHLLRKILQTMTAPRRARLGATAAHHGGHSGDATDWDHARGCAFTELVEHLPTDRLHPRTAATIVVSTELETLREELRVAHLDTGEDLSAGETRRLACGAGLIPAVLNGASVPLDLGRSARLFSETQRTALGQRHQTCASEGCERPFAWCELHHRVPWSHGGRTDLDQALPLCHFHHRRIHDPAYLHEWSEHGVRFRRRT